MIEYKLLNPEHPENLIEVPNGQRYLIETIGSSVIISACPEAVDVPIEPIVTSTPTLEDKINYLYYKSQGVI